MLPRILACTLLAASASAQSELLRFDRPPDHAYEAWSSELAVEGGLLRIDAPDRGGASWRPDPAADLSGSDDRPLLVVGRKGEGWDDASAAFLNLTLHDADGTTKDLRVNNWGLPDAGAEPGAVATEQTLGEAEVGRPGADGAFDASAVTTVELKGNWSDRRQSVALRSLRLGEPAADASGSAAGKGPAPAVTHVGAVQPDVLGVTIDTRRRVPAEQQPYRPEPGDRIKGEQDRWVVRGGVTLGALVTRDADTLYGFDRIEGAELDTAWADRPGSYRLVSPDASDPAYAEAKEPLEVHRKSKPTDEARLGEWAYGYPMRHVVYLRLPSPLRAGARYELRFEGDGPPLEARAFAFDPRRLRSEAVHVSQIGFRPGDPVKLGYLSLWMGDGGPAAYAAGTPFRVVDEGTREVVFEGQTRLSRGADEPELKGRNYNAVDVFELDFSGLTRPGTYRLVVEGIGSSYPFELREGVWEDAFVTSARGIFHHRSGAALGPPHTDYVRPRTMVPGEDGFMVYEADTPALPHPGTPGGQSGIFERLREHGTDRPVPEAYGGLMDAGDWDRGDRHLLVSRLFMEMLELHPGFFGPLGLNLPESGNPLPDLLDEALFNLDFYRRLQRPDGGVPGMVESTEHPRHGEASWQETLKVYATEPDPRATLFYAATATQAAYTLKEFGDLPGTGWPDAAAWLASARRALAWSLDALEGPWAASADDDEVRDALNLASVELYRLTGEPEHHDRYLATTVFHKPGPPVWVWRSHDRRASAFRYARLEGLPVDEQVRRNARQALIAEAEQRAEMTTRTGFGWTMDPGGWIGWSDPARPDAVGVLRAYELTGERRFLEAAIRSTGFGAGANAFNRSLTTGVGHDFPRNVLHIDSRVTNQPPPEGITVYGPLDEHPTLEKGEGVYWSTKKVVDAGALHPPVEAWPPLELHLDTYMHPAQVEYTVYQTIAPTAYVWGLLAATPR